VAKTAAALPATLVCRTHPPRVLPSHQIPGTASTFVPGHPTELLGCRYHGLNQLQPAGALATSARFAPGPIAAALNAARRIPNGVEYHCPVDFGETIVLAFGYNNGTTLTATVSTAGCEFANNGDSTIGAPGDVLMRLEAALGHDHNV
jgi:hypothetical protein